MIEEISRARSVAIVDSLFSSSQRAECGLYLLTAEKESLDTPNTLSQAAVARLARTRAKSRQSELFPVEFTPLGAKPFLKWAGGKTRLLAVLRKCLAREKFRKYFEPFLGGGALFFDLSPSCGILNDANPELMLCYQTVREQPEQLLRELSLLKVSEQEFYRIRGLVPEELSPVSRAARFIYLNKTCYNGLYRVNKNGRFNTPYGRNDNVSLVDERNLRAASRLLKNAQLICKDYQSALADAGDGDFVYLDPPYLPVGKYSDFKRYTKEYFYEEDHRKLADVCRMLSARGCFVLLSNSYHENISKLYSDFNQAIVEMPRFINCKGEGRGRVKELLISNRPLRLDR